VDRFRELKKYIVTTNILFEEALTQGIDLSPELIDFKDNLQEPCYRCNKTIREQLKQPCGIIQCYKGRLGFKKYYAILKEQVETNKLNTKEFVKQFMASYEPDTFIKDKHGRYMYKSECGRSGINVEAFFEDLVEDLIEHLKK
jgi:hypothetical protein